MATALKEKFDKLIAHHEALAQEHATKAASLRFALEALNGAAKELAQARGDKTLAKAIQLRGEAPPPTRGRPATPLSPYKQLTAQRRANARTRLEMLRAGPLTLAEWAAGSREAGLPGLTGIYNYIKAGWIKKQRDKYYFLRFPDDPAPPEA